MIRIERKKEDDRMRRGRMMSLFEIVENEEKEKTISLKEFFPYSSYTPEIPLRKVDEGEIIKSKKIVETLKTINGRKMILGWSMDNKTKEVYFHYLIVEKDRNRKFYLPKF